MASRLRITDALLKNPREPLRRDGVGIDRDTGTAKEKIKYDFEVLERGCHFDFGMHLENAEPSDFGLLFIALRELEYGLDVGGKRARGVGRVRLTGYTVRYFDDARGHKLSQFLTDGLLPLEKKVFEGWLKEEFEKLLPKPGPEAGGGPLEKERPHVDASSE
jgi:CRISPR/Cas system CSM-associated protein Csm3 (group 7 of RAMP superfamily)